jgi:rod shape-determining protein MreD
VSAQPLRVYPLARISTLAIIGRFAVALIGVVVIQGILSFKFRFFSYFDLPLIFSVYYGFTLGNPVASIVIGSSLGLMQDSLSGAVLGANGLSKTVIGFFAATAVSKFAVDQPVARILALFLFTIGDVLLVTIRGLMVGPAVGPVYAGAYSSWGLSAILNTLLGLVLFGYHDRWTNATT